jgi:tRNA U34 2-thiouridine synthase MnmA/TrmU
MNNKNNSPSALVLFSGGLDSILACKILEASGIIVTAFYLKSIFLDSQKAHLYAKKNKIKLLSSDFSKKHLTLIKNPHFGYGKNLNPCLDCRLAMLRAATKIFKEKNFNILASGEVLGQRPMSQNKNALELIERKSGLKGKILRPLSAKILPTTIYEKEKLISPKNLLNIRGRGRKHQLELAHRYGVKYYPSPAGGCLLTDPGYSERLTALLKNSPKTNLSDVSLLKLGRVFFFKKRLVIIGRNKEENEKLIQSYNSQKDILISLKDFLGPFLLVRNFDKSFLNFQDLKKIGGVLGHYYPRIRNHKNISIIIKTLGKEKIASVPNRVEF